MWAEKVAKWDGSSKNFDEYVAKPVADATSALAQQKGEGEALRAYVAVLRKQENIEAGQARIIHDNALSAFVTASAESPTTDIRRAAVWLATRLEPAHADYRRFYTRFHLFLAALHAIQPSSGVLGGDSYPVTEKDWVPVLGQSLPDRDSDEAKDAQIADSMLELTTETFARTNGQGKTNSAWLAMLEKDAQKLERFLRCQEAAFGSLPISDDSTRLLLAIYANGFERKDEMVPLSGVVAKLSRGSGDVRLFDQLLRHYARERALFRQILEKRTDFALWQLPAKQPSLDIVKVVQLEQEILLIGPKEVGKTAFIFSSEAIDSKIRPSHYDPTEVDKRRASWQQQKSSETHSFSLHARVPPIQGVPFNIMDPPGEAVADISARVEASRAGHLDKEIQQIRPSVLMIMVEDGIALEATDDKVGHSDIAAAVERSLTSIKAAAGSAAAQRIPIYLVFNKWDLTMERRFGGEAVLPEARAALMQETLGKAFHLSPHLSPNEGAQTPAVRFRADASRSDPARVRALIGDLIEEWSDILDICRNNKQTDVTLVPMVAQYDEEKPGEGVTGFWNDFKESAVPKFRAAVDKYKTQWVEQLEQTLTHLAEAESLQTVRAPLEVDDLVDELVRDVGGTLPEDWRRILANGAITYGSSISFEENLAAASWGDSPTQRVGRTAIARSKKVTDASATLQKTVQNRQAWLLAEIDIDAITEGRSRTCGDFVFTNEPDEDTWMRRDTRIAELVTLKDSTTSRSIAELSWELAQNIATGEIVARKALADDAQLLLDCLTADQTRQQHHHEFYGTLRESCKARALAPRMRKAQPAAQLLDEQSGTGIAELLLSRPLADNPTPDAPPIDMVKPVMAHLAGFDGLRSGRKSPYGIYDLALWQKDRARTVALSGVQGRVHHLAPLQHALCDIAQTTGATSPLEVLPFGKALQEAVIGALVWQLFDADGYDVATIEQERDAFKDALEQAINVLGDAMGLAKSGKSWFTLDPDMTPALLGVATVLEHYRKDGPVNLGRKLSDAGKSFDRLRFLLRAFSATTHLRASLSQADVVQMRARERNAIRTYNQALQVYVRAMIKEVATIHATILREVGLPPPRIEDQDEILEVRRTEVSPDKQAREIVRRFRKALGLPEGT